MTLDQPSFEELLRLYANRINLMEEDVREFLVHLRAAVAFEREACARIAESYVSPAPLSGLILPRRCGCNVDIAAAIRARGAS